MSENIAEELAALKKQQEEAIAAANARAESAEKTAKEAHSYMEDIRKAASGEKDPAVQPETFVDKVLKNGDTPVRSVVQEELNRRAYFDTLRTNFRKDNPNLTPMEDEVFAVAQNIINQNAQQGKSTSWEDALKASTDHYGNKQKQMLKMAGADASPMSMHGYPESRYAGSDVDYFAMSDPEFKVLEKKEDDERRKRNRGFLSHYGNGR